LNNALTRLSVEGLVGIQPQRGTVVAPIDAEKLEEAYKIRSSFELYVALCIFKYLKDEDYAFFEDVEIAMNTLVNSSDQNWLDMVPGQDPASSFLF
jgi:DNA-binding GntR family transcriptional regulator